MRTPTSTLLGPQARKPVRAAGIHTSRPDRCGRAFALAAVLAIAAPSLNAAEIEGVEFAPSAQVRDQSLALHAVGLLRYMVFFKAYVAGLYLGEGVTPSQVLDDTPKRLEIHYFYPIATEDFRSSTEAAILQNVGPEAFEAIRASVAAFNALYRDVTPGDRYALSYLPGVGTELALNGEALGTIEGAEFARAVFSIWFGPEEIDSALKEALLAER